MYKSKKLIITRFKNCTNFTLGAFLLIDEEENLLQQGYTLEPGYPDTITPNQNKRIPKGLYGTIKHKSFKFKKELPLLYSPRVSKNRYILIHSGNTKDHTQGCILIGEHINIKNSTLEQSKLALSKLLKHTKDSDFLVEIH